MSRDIAPFGVRMPADLKEHVERSAKENGRSMNAEIVHRLELSFALESANEEVLTANKAKAVALAAQSNLLENSKRECLARIKSSALKGLNRADFDFIEFVGLPDNVDLDENEPLYQKLVIPLVTYLTELGYQTTVSGNDLFIDF